MPKRRITAAQKAASVANLAKARAARRRHGTPKGKLASQVGPLKRTRVVLRKGQLHRATTNFRGLTVIHQPALSGAQLKQLTMKHKRVR